MWPSVRCRWVHASAWTMRRPHPASTYSAAMTSGVRTMRWASNGSVVWAWAAAMTAGPNVRLGTNWPSITSHWMRSTPAASSAATSSPSLAKSAGRTLGAISIGRVVGTVGRVPGALAAAPGRLPHDHGPTAAGESADRVCGRSEAGR